MALLLKVATLLAWARITLQASTANEPFYSAGVVEFRPSKASESEARMLENLNGYLTILDSDEAQNLDIIVFPESTLNNNRQATFVPNPANGLVPCDMKSDLYHNLLVQLSCAAKNISTYIVINLTEKEWCNTLPEDTRACSSTGLNIYNTNVVFDRNGAVISRYRKVHLYGENKNTTFTPEIGWFDTDFGIRFGHFICFDILFYAPAQLMVVQNGIKDFLFPSMWFSQLPFLTSVQFHQAWSYANNVNLLAKGSSDPLIGSTGSGVYHGRKGIVVAKMNQNVGERKLYVAQVPKFRYLGKRSLSESHRNLTRSFAPNIKVKRDYLENYETILLNLSSNGSLRKNMCFSKSSFCCYFDVQWQIFKLEATGKHYRYRLGVYDGLRNDLAAETNQLKNCAIFSCIGEDKIDCGKLLDTDFDVVFENITITATFPKAERFLIMPNSLNAKLMPLPVQHFTWQETDKKNSVQVRYELNTTTPNIMAFSIYGNYYDSILDIVPDKDDSKTDGATSLTHSLGGIITLLFIVLVI